MISICDFPFEASTLKATNDGIMESFQLVEDTQSRPESGRGRVFVAQVSCASHMSNIQKGLYTSLCVGGLGMHMN